MATTFFEAALVVLPVVIVLSLFELTFGEDNLDIFFDEVVFSPPSVCKLRFNTVDPTEFQVVKAG